MNLYLSIQGCVCRLLTRRYPSDNIGFQAENADGEVEHTLSIYVEGVELGEREFVASHDLDPEVLADLLDSGLFADTGRRVDYGFVKDRPVLSFVGGYRLDHVSDPPVPLSGGKQREEHVYRALGALGGAATLDQVRSMVDQTDDQLVDSMAALVERGRVRLNRPLFVQVQEGTHE